MPEYKFKCKKCDEKFEITMSMTERGERKITCPACNSADITQVFSGFNYIIKKDEPACPADSSCSSCCESCRSFQE
ncbi:MAG: zinc ribbon domain-containing protein [Eubacteriales bacterium]|jgi:putative FmdB family regulatory protein|nr:zinc ribbon domain-containing protein [Eubacteriales bacterium]